ncbi:hypothetical protein J3458_020751 [Metarhizium acridum]|uniref:uncharacterized protein n=1 Tax=Metarhizium acridum TaxID=92637 RepID=UPI001C6CF1BF|nr:hypothetical protein J3458_020751 [Metarhizium acridum]
MTRGSSGLRRALVAARFDPMGWPREASQISSNARLELSHFGFSLLCFLVRRVLLSPLMMSGRLDLRHLASAEYPFQIQPRLQPTAGLGLPTFRCRGTDTGTIT